MTHATDSVIAEDLDWELPDALSIVVQGALFSGNTVETARHCQHWRDLFPQAQIILAISTTDLLADQHIGLLGKLSLVRAYRDNVHLRTALDIITAACDIVVLSENTLPLPPIKSISDQPNNINYQIAAAKAGLAYATGRYTLRTRADLIFADRQFLSQYREGVALPRGQNPAFHQRVLISNLYTLNPFTFERMPLHYSDWFHYGLTSDIVRLWAAPPMTFGDATYYKTHPHAWDSSIDERFLVPRLAVEQHILYNCLKDSYPDIKLEYHNDRSSIGLALDILADDFIVCDLVEAKCIFDKYSMDFDAPAKALHCVTREDWIALTHSSGEERLRVLRDKLDYVRSPESRPFPRNYQVAALATKVGHRDRGTIFAADSSGVIVHGPYDTLPEGQYVAAIQVPTAVGPGAIDIRITFDEGREVAAERRVVLGFKNPTEIEIAFDVVSSKAKKFEIVVTLDKVHTIAIAAVTVRVRPASHSEKFKLSLPAGSWPMHTAAGIATELGVKTTGAAGYLLYGPHTGLGPGSYSATFTFPEGSRVGWSFVEMSAGEKHMPVWRQRIRNADLRAGMLRHDFELDRELRNVEFRVRISRRAEFSVDTVVIEQHEAPPRGG